MDKAERLDLSKGSLGIIRQWLTDCTSPEKDPETFTYHSWCNLNRGSFLPSRILDLGKGDIRSDLRLVTRREILRSRSCTTHRYPTRNSPPKIDRLPAYATLSHRWDGAKTVRTTSENLKERRSSIPFEGLNRVFQQAILITRQLDIQYIWIDSLCIIQDSAKDWEEESKMMGEIYRASALNIADASPIIREDLEHLTLPNTKEDRTSTETEGDCVDTGSDPDYTGDSYMPEFKTGKLESRGWVLQERLLAPATLYIGTEKLRWICRSFEFYEANPEESIEHPAVEAAKREYRMGYRSVGIDFRGNWDYRHIGRFLADDDTGRRGNAEEAIWMWLYVVDQYSKRLLTFESDRLAAISGLAKHFADALGTHRRSYLAGLWVGNIELSLLWKARQPVRRSLKFIAPSWSWASLLSQVCNEQRSDYGPRTDIDYLITVVGYEVCVPSSNPYGPLFDQTPTSLRIRGRLVKGRLSADKSELIIQEQGFTVEWDYPQGSIPDFGVVWFLPLCFFYACSNCDGLVLSEVESPAGRVFRRIGYCSLFPDDDEYEEWISDARRQIFTLV